MWPITAACPWMWLFCLRAWAHKYLGALINDEWTKKKKKTLCRRKCVPLRAALLNLSSRFDQNSIVTWMKLFNSQDWNCHKEIEHFSAQYRGRWGNSPRQWRQQRWLARQDDWTRWRRGHLNSHHSLHNSSSTSSPLFSLLSASRRWVPARFLRLI